MGTSAVVERSWVARPWLSRLIRLLAFLVPVVASVGSALALSSWIADPDSPGVAVLRWLGIAAASTVVLVAVERLTRRLLPLSTLFTLTLAFPDRVPSRFRIAIRIGTTSQLRRRLEEVRRGEVGDTPGEVAERLLELVALLSKHDRLTRGHSERVRAYTHIVGEQMGLSGVELDRLRWAALLHDIGKLTVSAEILNKSGRLTHDEFDEIKTHPMAGKALVAPLAGWLGDSVRAVWEHHERFDGAGYPQGLAGDDISLAARIVCVTDSFDVMTSARSYKKPMPAADARRELARCSGTQFDPVVVRAFLAASLGTVRSSAGSVSLLAQLALLPRAFAAQLGGSVAAGTALGVGAVAGVVGYAATPIAMGQELRLPPEVAASMGDVAGTGPSSSGDGEASAPRGSTAVAPSPTDQAELPPGTTDGPAPVGAGPDGSSSPPDAGPGQNPTTGGVNPPGGSVPGSPPVVPGVDVPPTGTVPPVSGPGGSLPGVPGVSGPGGSLPGVPPVGGSGPGGSTPGSVPATTVAPVTPPTLPPTWPSGTVPPTTVPPVTSPPVTFPPVTSPPVTSPPVTSPPVTSPPVTSPPVTSPPVTLPPVTSPPVTFPPVTSPPVTFPPVTSPPVTSPTVTFPPTTLPPVTVAPTTLPPVTVPPTTLPPVTVAPTTLPPVTVPPTTLPPVTAPTVAL